MTRIERKRDLARKTLMVLIFAFMPSVYSCVLADEKSVQERGNDRQGFFSSLKNQSNFKEATYFAKNREENMGQGLHQNDIRWAEDALLQNHKIQHSKSTASIHPIARNGVDINSMINKYSTQMPSNGAWVRNPFHDVLIFISFSMPAQSLREWWDQARRAGGVLVMRGLVDNSFHSTALAMQRLMGNNAAGIEVDPTLFKRFGIRQVPAVVVINGEAPMCFDEDSCKHNVPPFDVIYGNVSLQRALEEIADKGSIAKDKATLILNHVRTSS